MLTVLLTIKIDISTHHEQFNRLIHSLPSLLNILELLLITILQLFLQSLCISKEKQFSRLPCSVPRSWSPRNLAYDDKQVTSPLFLAMFVWSGARAPGSTTAPISTESRGLCVSFPQPRIVTTRYSFRLVYCFIISLN